MASTAATAAVGTVAAPGAPGALQQIPMENGSKSKRRRYFANGRSRTIELSTLAEIDEEEFAKTEGASSQPDNKNAERVLTTQDDMCIGTTGGTYKSLKRGSVKAQALKLSERLAQKVAAENAAKEREEKSEMEKQSCSKPVVVDVKLRRNLTEIRRDIRNFETTTDFTTPQDWPPQPQHEYQQNIQMQRHPLSRSASFVTPAPMIVYGMPPPPGDRMSMIDSRCDSRIGEYAMPLYYMPAPPPPQPVFLPYSKLGMSPFDQPSMVMMPGHPALPYPELQMRRKMQSSGEGHRRKSWCSRICCAGFAQLLWTIVCIISFGIIASLILALCYM